MKELKFFKYPDDFACKCGLPTCDAVKFDEESAEALDDFRSKFGQPMVITSGARCKTHNAAVGGEPDSQHLLGIAVDIRSPGGDYMRRMVAEALTAGYNGIGIKKGMVHLDRRKTTPVVWGY